MIRYISFVKAIARQFCRRVFEIIVRIRRPARYCTVAVKATHNLPVLAGIAVPAVGVAIIQYAGIENGPVYYAGLRVPGRAEELVIRSCWLVSAILLVIGMISVTCLGLANICACIPLDRRRMWVKNTLICSFCAFIITAIVSLADEMHGFRSSWVLIEMLPMRMSSTGFFHMLNSLGAIPTVFVVSSVSASIYKLSSDRFNSPDTLRISIQCVQRMLYLIGIVLVIAVFELFLVHTWASKYTIGAGGEFARSVSIALSGAVGALYTIFLIAVFLPAMLLQRRKAENLAKHIFPHEIDYPNRSRWLVEHDLVLTVPDSLARAGAALGPIVAGSLVPLLAGIF